MKAASAEQVALKLEELSRRHPAWRVGQLVANVSDWAEADIWDVEDAEFLAAAEAHLAAAARYPPERLPARRA